MEYYKSNALYEYIKSKNLPQFKFVVGNAWQLVYGDNSCRPLVLILAAGVDNAVLNDSPSENDKLALNLLQIAGSKAQIPVKYIRFPSNVEEVEHVMVSNTTFNYTRTTMPELSAMFGSFGLPVSNTHTAKYLNDKTSSAYHKWQRSSLGVELTVSDIDLWKVNEIADPRIIYELKRSFYDLNRWQPFKDDYRNFQLISNLCNKAGMQFKIIYNQFIKNPYQDIINNLKIFSIDFSKNPPIKDDGITSLDQFVNL